MEKQTIGGFIAALRKANGMTQKQLAEKLNVSDKSVSRWERDECAPDLSLIPVIAEIFNVTSDELLRGQRMTADSTPTKYEQQKTDKQLRHLLNRSLTNFRIRSTISMGIALGGVISASICNFAFLRAYVGFGIGCIFYLCAAICQVIFTICAFSSISNDDFCTDQMNEAKSKMLSLTIFSGSFIAGLFAYTLPLATQVWDAYIGLDGDAWFASGIISAVICAVICAFISGIVKFQLTKAGTFPQSESTRDIIRFRLKWLAIAAALCMLTVTVSQLILPGVLSASDFTEGKVFDNWQDFKECIEAAEGFEGETYGDVTILPSEDEYRYTGEDGEIYSNPLPIKDVIMDNTGATIIEYYWINDSITQIEYGDPENNYLPVTAYSTSDIREGNVIMENIQTIILLLMIPEIAACIMLYRRSKKKTME